MSGRRSWRDTPVSCSNAITRFAGTEFLSTHFHTAPWRIEKILATAACPPALVTASRTKDSSVFDMPPRLPLKVISTQQPEVVSFKGRIRRVPKPAPTSDFWKLLVALKGYEGLTQAQLAKKAAK